MAKRRFFPRATLRNRTTLDLVWSPTQFATTTTADQSVAISIDDNLETKLGHNLHNGVLQAVRGDIALYINPTSAATLTRTMVSLGIAWANDDNISGGSGTTDASYPRPSDDSFDWIWRKNVPIAFASVQAVSGDNQRSGLGKVSVFTKVRRKQPSLRHSLYLFVEWNNTYDANITSVGVMGMLNTLVKLP